VQVVEVEHVRGHGPARAVRQAGRQPGHPVLPGGQRHGQRVGQRPVSQREVFAGWLQFGGPLGELSRR
jgi:hypothetical protein